MIIAQQLWTDCLQSSHWQRAKNPMRGQGVSAPSTKELHGLVYASGQIVDFRSQAGVREWWLFFLKPLKAESKGATVFSHGAHDVLWCTRPQGSFNFKGDLHFRI